MAPSNRVIDYYAPTTPVNTYLQDCTSGIELWRYRHPETMDQRNEERLRRLQEEAYGKWLVARGQGRATVRFRPLDTVSAEPHFEKLRPNGYCMTDEEYDDYCRNEPIRQQEEQADRHRPSPSPTPPGSPHPANIPNKRQLTLEALRALHRRPQKPPATSPATRNVTMPPIPPQTYKNRVFEDEMDLSGTPMGSAGKVRWTQVRQRPTPLEDPEIDEASLSLKRLPLNASFCDQDSASRKRGRAIWAWENEDSEAIDRSMKRRKHRPQDMYNELSEFRYPAIFANPTETLDPTVEKDDSERPNLIIEEQGNENSTKDTTADKSMHDKTDGEANITEADDDGDRTPTPPEDPEINEASLSLKLLPQPRLSFPENASASRKRGRAIDEWENKDYNSSDERDPRSQRSGYDSEAKAPASKRHKQYHNNKDNNIEESQYHKILTDATEQPGFDMSSKSDSLQDVVDEDNADLHKVEAEAETENRQPVEDTVEDDIMQIDEEPSLPSPTMKILTSESNADRHPTEAEAKPENKQHAEDTVEEDSIQTDEESSLPPPPMKILRKINDGKLGRRPCTRSQKAPNIALDMRKGGRVVVETTSEEKKVMTMAEYMMATQT